MSRTVASGKSRQQVQRTRWRCVSRSDAPRAGGQKREQKKKQSLRVGCWCPQSTIAPSRRRIERRINFNWITIFFVKLRGIFVSFVVCASRDYGSTRMDDFILIDLTLIWFNLALWDVLFIAHWFSHFDGSTICRNLDRVFGCVCVSVWLFVENCCANEVARRSHATHRQGKRRRCRSTLETMRHFRSPSEIAIFFSIFTGKYFRAVHATFLAVQHSKWNVR